jgi:hypothetical protein
MANEVEIIVRSKDQSAPGIDSAIRRVRKLKEEAASVRDVRVDVEVDDDAAKVELATVQREAEQLDGDDVKLAVKVDDDAAKAELKTVQLEADHLAAEDVKVRVKVDVDKAAAKVALRTVQREADHLDGKDVNVEVKVDTDKAGSRLEALREKLKKLKDKGFSPLITAALALGPALLPIAGQAITIIGALATSLASAGAAAGVFGAIIASTFGEVKEAAHKTEGLQEKIRLLDREIKLAEPGSKLQESLIKSRAKATNELAAQLSLLPPVTRRAVTAFEGMKTAWDDLKDDNKETSFGILTRVFKLAQDIIPKLQPLFDAGAHAADKLLKIFERKVKDGGVERLIKFLADHARGSLSDVIDIFKNLASALGNFMKATDDGGGALHWVEEITKKLADFTASKAFLDFLQWVHDSGPMVGQTLRDIAVAAGKLIVAIAPLAALSLVVADGLARIIGAIPAPVLTAIVAGLIAYSVGVRALAAAQVVWAAKSYIAAGAQWLLNSAMAANPIGIVVVAIAALTAGLIYAYNHSKTFRDIVNKVGSALVAAGKAAWNFEVSLIQAIARAVAFVIDKFGDMATFVGQVLSHIPGMGAAGHALQVLGGKAHGAAQKIREVANWMSHLKSKTVGVTVRVTTATVNGQHVTIRDRGSGGVNFTSTDSHGHTRTQRAFAHGGIAGHAAEGGARTGRTMVGEHGPELVDLAPGSTVHSNPDTERMLGAGSPEPARVVLEINSGGSAMDDLLVQVLRKAVRTRGGNVQLVLGR